MIFLHEKRVEYQDPMTSDDRRMQIDEEATIMQRWEKMYAINHFLFVFWIPCIVIICSYIVVLLILQGHLKQGKWPNHPGLANCHLGFQSVAIHELASSFGWSLRILGSMSQRRIGRRQGQLICCNKKNRLRWGAMEVKKTSLILNTNLLITTETVQFARKFPLEEPNSAPWQSQLSTGLNNTPNDKPLLSSSLISVSGALITFSRFWTFSEFRLWKNYGIFWVF